MMGVKLFIFHGQDYIQVNQIFADKTLEAIQMSIDQEPGIEPLVWIHDYHLTLTPSIIRQVMIRPFDDLRQFPLKPRTALDDSGMLRVADKSFSTTFNVYMTPHLQ